MNSQASIVDSSAVDLSFLNTVLATQGTDSSLVLTTQELAHMIKEAGIIFGVTGGVSEAVLRLAFEKLTKQELKDVIFTEVRGYSGLRSCELKIGGNNLSLGVVNGLANARKVLGDLKLGKVHIDLVEVMACPGGCIGGGGHPITYVNRTIRQKRGAGLYQDDKKEVMHKS